jgi:ABC-type transport system substrate-binding protein
MKSALETFIPICEKDEFRLAKKLIRKIERALPTQRKTVKGEILIASAEAKERYGGTIIIGHSTEPESINPILTTSTISANIIDLVFSRLVRYHSKEMVAPEVAEHWEISDDGLVWTFYLRDDVSFHDGYPLNAHDVAFTYRAICDPRNNSPYASRYWDGSRICEKTNYLHVVTLSPPYE